MASVAAASDPHTGPKAEANYATVVIQPWQASAEGLQEVWAAGTEVVGKHNFPGSAGHVSTIM